MESGGGSVLQDLTHGEEVPLILWCVLTIHLECERVQCLLLLLVLVVRLLECARKLIQLVKALEGLLLVLHKLEQQHLEDRRHVVALCHILLVLHLALLFLVLLNRLGAILLVEDLLELLGVVDIASVGALDKLHLQEQVLQVLGQLASIAVLGADFQAWRRTLEKLLLQSGGALGQHVVHQGQVSRLGRQARRRALNWQLLVAILREGVLDLAD